jgi:hypothetical protein
MPLKCQERDPAFRGQVDFFRFSHVRTPRHGAVSLLATVALALQFIAAVYWITSSAVANSVSGMVRPRALALLQPTLL